MTIGAVFHIPCYDGSQLIVMLIFGVIIGVMIGLMAIIASKKGADQ